MCCVAACASQPGDRRAQSADVRRHIVDDPRMRLVADQVLFAAAALILGAAGRAQEEKQVTKPVFVRVLDQDGEPLAAAEVLAAWEPGGVPGLEPAQHVIGRSDARGYCRLDLPPGVLAHAVATGPMREDGWRMVSTTTAFTVATPRVELQAKMPRQQRTLAVQGLAPWRALGPFRISLQPMMESSFRIEVPIADDDSVELPAFASRNLEILCADGSTLQPVQVRNDGFVALPPKETPVLAVDDKGNPVAGVRILHRSAERAIYGSSRTYAGALPRFREVAVTGEDGRAVAKLPVENNPLEKFVAGGHRETLILLAQQDQCAWSFSGFEGGHFVDGKRLGADAEPKEIRFVLAPEQPLRCRLPRPFARAGEPVMIRWTSKVAENNGWTHLPMAHVVEVAADGTFGMPGLPLDAYDLSFRVAPRIDAEGQPIPVALAVANNRPTDVFEPLGTEARTARVRVLDAQGAPRPNAEISVLTQNGNSFESESACSLATDRTGTANVLLPAVRTLLLTVGEAGHAYAIHEPSEEPAIELRLKPLDELRGVVVDADGNPVAGASVRVHRTSSRGMVRGPEDIALDFVANHAHNKLTSATSAEDGTFVMRFLQRPNRTMQARASANGKTSESFTVEPLTEPLRLVLR